MTLNNAELLALAVPVVGAVMAGLVAWATRHSVRRRRQRLQRELMSRSVAQSGEELVEIRPDAIVSIQRDERQRLYIRARSLRTLAARINS
jgi:hypothetical protein